MLKFNVFIVASLFCFACAHSMDRTIVDKGNGLYYLNVDSWSHVGAFNPRKEFGKLADTICKNYKILGTGFTIRSTEDPNDGISATTQGTIQCTD